MAKRFPSRFMSRSMGIVMRLGVLWGAELIQ